MTEWGRTHIDRLPQTSGQIRLHGRMFEPNGFSVILAIARSYIIARLAEIRELVELFGLRSRSREAGVCNFLSW
jgi:hypothetical protein